jgi:hypothetical protein
MQLINIVRIIWPANHEDFKSLDDGRSDHHRGQSSASVDTNAYEMVLRMSSTR